MDFQESLHALYSLINYEKTDFTYSDLKLDRMREFIALLDHPEKSSKIILIAGTKGKGSTSYFLDRILSFSQMKCGLYVKPHLLTFRERIRFNGDLIQPRELAQLVTDIFPVIEKMGRHSLLGKPTYFEVSVALAFQYFKECLTDYAVMEVGLGGRLDATNVCEPCLTVITPISYDHTEILGETIPEIAREKAGILRSHVPLILGPQEKFEAQTTILNIAQRLAVPVVSFYENCSYQILRRGENGSVFQWMTKKGQGGVLSLPLLGDQQVTNFLTAVLAAEQLGCLLSNDQLQTMLNGINWPGRIQVLNELPLVIFDVAHNQASFATLRNTLRDYLHINEAVFLLGFLNGKDYPGIAEELSRMKCTLFLTTPFNPKAVLPTDIIHFFSPHHSQVEVMNDPYEAFECAINYASNHHLPLVVAGSFYLAKLFNDKLKLAIVKEEVELC